LWSARIAQWSLTANTPRNRHWHGFIVVEPRRLRIEQMRIEQTKVGSHRVAKRSGGNGVNRGIRAPLRDRPEAFSTFVRIASRQGRRHDIY
jgi:hypothetical protein